MLLWRLMTKNFWWKSFWWKKHTLRVCALIGVVIGWITDCWFIDCSFVITIVVVGDNVRWCWVVIAINHHFCCCWWWWWWWMISICGGSISDYWCFCCRYSRISHDNRLCCWLVVIVFSCVVGLWALGFLWLFFVPFDGVFEELYCIFPPSAWPTELSINVGRIHACLCFYRNFGCFERFGWWTCCFRAVIHTRLSHDKSL